MDPRWIIPFAANLVLLVLMREANHYLAQLGVSVFVAGLVLPVVALRLSRAPAMLAVATVMAGTNVGVAAAIDHTNGLYDRFGTLAMPRGLPAAARTLNEIVFTVPRAALMVAAAWMLLGFRFHGGVLDATGGLGVLLVLAGAMSALFGRIGDRLRRPDVVQFAGMMIMMPLMFVSSAFAPLETMPGWMRAMASLNPVAHATDALRGHVLGTATGGDTVTPLIAAIGLWAVVVAVPVVIRRIRPSLVR